MDALDKVYPISDTVRPYIDSEEEDLNAVDSLPHFFDGRDTKEILDDLGAWYLRTDAEHRGEEAKLKPIIDELQARLKSYESKKNWIKSQINRILEPSLFADHTDEKVSLFYMKSEKVEITDFDRLPIDYTRVKTEPDTAAIKEALKNNQEVPGATLKENFNLQVKLGGPNAIKNSQKRLDKRLKETNG